MATKEEIEGELKQLREQHEKLKLRYKEVVTKLELASDLLDVTVCSLEPSLRSRSVQPFLKQKIEMAKDT